MKATLSPKFQVVIPQSARRHLKLIPGTKFQIFVYENRIEFVPERSPQELRGLLRGIDTEVERDGDRV